MIRYTKAHACGNDFLIVDQAAVPEDRQAATARRLCERTRGVGADGVEYFIWTGEQSGSVRLFNADGSTAEISGNGTRCVAAWMAQQRGLKAGAALTLATAAGTRELTITSVHGFAYEMVSSMGVPTVHAAWVVLTGGMAVHGAVVHTGNPHFVIFVDNADYMVQGKSWQEIGKAICFHADFPKQTNVEFVRVLDPGAIEIRIFERGVGPTTSSGTGTCATAAASIALHRCTSTLQVTAPGGKQQVDWAGSAAEVFLTGPAVITAAGEAYVDANDGGAGDAA